MGCLLEFHSVMKHFVSILSNDCSDAICLSLSLGLVVIGLLSG
jgi:hypothetical protein